MKKTRLFSFLALLLTAVVLLSACGSKKASAENVTLGRLDGFTYTNSYLGIRLILDDSWQILPVGDAQDLGQADASSLKGAALTSYLQEHKQLFDLISTNVSDLTGVNVLYEALDEDKKAQFAGRNSEYVIDYMVFNAGSVSENLAQSGIQMENMEKISVSFLGKTVPTLKISATMHGLDYYVLQIVDYRDNGVLVSIAITSYIEDNTLAKLSLFEAL